MKASAIILAGGKSKRLGRDKSLVEIGGEPLIIRVISRLEELSSDIVIVTTPEHPLPVVQGRKGVRVIYDTFPGKGALGGVFTGLSAASSPYSIVVACDMPFLNVTLLKHMVESSEGFDVCIPRFDSYLEPLHAVYSKSCLPMIKSLLENNEMRIVSLLSYVRVNYIDEAELDIYDPRRLSFLNINTEEDMRRANDIGRGD